MFPKIVSVDFINLETKEIKNNDTKSLTHIVKTQNKIALNYGDKVRKNKIYRHSSLLK